MKLIILFIISAFALAAQTRSVALAWVDTQNPATGTSYNVYKAPGVCPASGTPTWGTAPLNATPLTTKTYTDTPIAIGTSACYAVTALFAGVESAKSIPVSVQVGPFQPTGLSAVVQ